MLSKKKQREINEQLKTLTREQRAQVIDKLIDLVEQESWLGFESVTSSDVNKIKKAIDERHLENNTNATAWRFADIVNWMNANEPTTLKIRCHRKDPRNERISVSMPECFSWQYLDCMVFVSIEALGLLDAFMDTNDKVKERRRELSKQYPNEHIETQNIFVNTLYSLSSGLNTKSRMKKLVEQRKREYDKEFPYQKKTHLDLIYEYTDWHELSRNKDVVENQVLLTQFAHLLNWPLISSLHTLSDDFVEKHHDRIDWYSISRSLRISNEMAMRFKNRIMWDRTTKTRKKKFSQEFQAELMLKGFM